MDWGASGARGLDHGRPGDCSCIPSRRKEDQRMGLGYGAQGTQEAVGRVLTHSAEICRADRTGQDRG